MSTPREQVTGLVAWSALVLLQLAWHGVMFPPTQLSMLLVLGITVVPLLLPVFSLPDKRRALLWVGILSLFYFCHGIAEAWSTPPERVPALLEIGLTLLLIGTLGAGVRRPKTPTPG
jgi:uncharacterized membrane protein